MKISLTYNHGHGYETWREKWKLSLSQSRINATGPSTSMQKMSKFDKIFFSSYPLKNTNTNSRYCYCEEIDETVSVIISERLVQKQYRNKNDRVGREVH